MGAGCVALALLALGVWTLVAGAGPPTLDLRHYAALVLAVAMQPGSYIGTELLLRSREASVALNVVLRRRAALEGQA